MSVYKLYCISDEDCFYVGSTVKPLNVRLNHHLCIARKGSTRKVYETMRNVGLDNWRIELLEESDLDDLKEREQALIEQYQPPLNSIYACGRDEERRSSGNRVRSKRWQAANEELVSARGKEWRQQNSNRYNCSCGYHTSNSCDLKKHMNAKSRRGQNHVSVEQPIVQDDE